MGDGSKKNDSKKPEEKVEKDFTGILELSAMMPPPTAEEIANQDPFVVNEMKAVEQIDQFESIDQIGMMDHVPEAPLDTPADPPLDLGTNDSALPPLDDSFSVSTESTPDPHAMDFSVEQASVLLPDDSLSNDLSSMTNFDPAPIAETPREATTGSAPSSSPEGFSFVNEAAVPAETPKDPFADHVPSSQKTYTKTASGIDGIKQYSERARETSFQSNLKNPFHLWLAGSFDPFSRDKLLLFITENPMGLNSMELDRQINAGKVLFPRISEFAGIKLIQDLRDSGLSFKLHPSSRDEDDVLPQAENLRLQYESGFSVENPTVPIVLPGAVDPKLWQAFDSIQMVQFLKAEIVEVERSEIFQELLERMMASLKNKARLKGAAAIGSLEHQLKPLRLPSHYQLELKASLLKKL